MNITLTPSPMAGHITLPPSKSVAHRHFFLAALSGKPAQFKIATLSDDLRATLNAVGALGMEHHIEKGVLRLMPKNKQTKATVDCIESASTLRMAMMILPTQIPDIRFTGKASLFARPMDEGITYLKNRGVEVHIEKDAIITRNTYTPESTAMSGKITSQFITGAMLAATTASEPVTITVREKTSAPYLHMTEEIIKEWSIRIKGDIICSGELTAPAPLITIEEDRSHAAYFHAANALGAEIIMKNISGESLQGDDAFPELLRQMKEGKTVDLTFHPDLLMPLAVAATKTGGVMTGVERLRYKESDRIATTREMLTALSIESSYESDIFTVSPGRVKGGTIHTGGDHRIAFAAAILASVADGPVTVMESQCVEKSWPDFWNTIKTLGEDNR
ncbi:putative 3-phosphoshikimate 1-carboxyvinyltransferase [Aedoeadaptatus nemausensis]|uniref:3-phosphoshikimate 1-carboxyvinyltransferase n=1 Tax=Aedoeadaptatus nemausensis TaxID=2582829 RepID=A0A6V6Y8A8_9FIRM|nr:hypothetical protein [Peptoniphilus nemausensis]CAC9934999.1 putative 3-phosphoshikimate 1-carboxyvinyltransferase [Peptoniphilus nemausensis]